MRALGLMSGTSMDGVDAAVLDTDGERIEAFGPSAFAPYEPEDRALLRGALGRWPGEAGVDAVEARVRATHAAAVAGFGGVEVVGFHGQTLAHAPRGRGTHQAGRGDLLAEEAGVPVVRTSAPPMWRAAARARRWRRSFISPARGGWGRRSRSPSSTSGASGT